MEKNPNNQKSKVYDDTENLFKALASGLDENAKEKIKSYVERIKKGESKESVLQGQKEDSIFRKGVDALLENENNKTKEKEETQKTTAELKASLREADKKKEDSEINTKLKSIGLDTDDLKNNETWQNFSKAEKLLIIEQASQDTLSHVREIGEKRFQEKNTIKLSWNPLDFKSSFFIKIKNKIGKSYWISKEEKEVINEVEKGGVKPDQKILDSLIKRQNDLGLSVIEKNGRAFIEFATGNKNLSNEEKNIIDKYNEQANIFGKMPDSWKNKLSAKSTDKIFTKNNHDKYLEVKLKYEEERNRLVELKTKQYEASGLGKVEAAEKSMQEVKDMDLKLSMLQFTNTNPDSLEELNKIRSESSWGRLLNNENIWRSIYMSAGYTAKGATHATLGLLAAPIVSGAIGGIRARRKANENINKAFKEGTKEETFLERKEQNKKGIFDDKNKNQGLLTDIFSGQKVNTKEVAAFVDADSQKQRIDNLINKINNTENKDEKVSLLQQLTSRIEYIELKQQQGLINYGNKNPIGKNYELFKSLSEAYVNTTSIKNLGKEATKEMKADILEREALLQNIMSKNEEIFGKKIAEYKNRETLRGATVAAGFAVLGGLIRDWLHHDNIHPIASSSVNEISPDRQHQINEALIKGHEAQLKNVGTEATAIAKHGDGGIVLARKLQKSLMLKYGSDLSKAPESVKHIINTDATKLAKEFEMYKPNQDEESALIHVGDSITEKNGEITFHDKFGNKEINLMKGDNVRPIHTYEGKMADTDHSGLKNYTTNTEESSHLYKVPPQVNPVTGESIEAASEHTDTIEDSPYKVPPQVNPVTGEPMPQQVNHVTEENIIKPETKILNPTVSTEGPSFTREIILNSEENLKHIFPTEKLMETYNYIKANVSAEKLIALGRKEGVADAYKPLISYMDKLEEVSHLKPIGKSLINEAESISDYIIRASTKAAEMGRLDEIKF